MAERQTDSSWTKTQRPMEKTEFSSDLYDLSWPHVRTFIKEDYMNRCGQHGSEADFSETFGEIFFYSTAEWAKGWQYSESQCVTHRPGSVKYRLIHGWKHCLTDRQTLCSCEACYKVQCKAGRNLCWRPNYIFDSNLNAYSKFGKLQPIKCWVWS